MVWAEWLVDVVRVAGVAGESVLWRGGLSLGQDLLASSVVPLEHLNGEDVVDLNEMGTEAVVQEVWWEHHVVSGEPKLWLILVVELEHVAGANETEPVEDVHGGEAVYEESGVVKGTSGDAEHSGENHSAS